MAGVEPDPGQSTKRLMVHDFRRKTLIPRRFSPSIESLGVDPSRGDILEVLCHAARVSENFDLWQ